MQIEFGVISVIDFSKADPGEEIVWTKIETIYYAAFVYASIKLLDFAMWIIFGQRKQENRT